MNNEAFKKKQEMLRKECLERILQSGASKRLIASGPGTGKTYTFKQVLSSTGSTDNLAMTFIRRLVDDMRPALANYAEVKTFHAYCKKVLHEQNGKVELVPYLSKLIERDSKLLGYHMDDFDGKFQILAEHSAEISFYLSRGDYYDRVSFNDSVYRLYKYLRRDPTIVPSFDLIVIDEFQDFNPLEVAFIDELEKKGDILIVGDDDQAVYHGRNASPSHLRDKYSSGDYDLYELPFCGRCPEVIVKATNSILDKAQSLGFLQGRIPKRYECYLESTETASIKYPSIVTARLTTVTVVPKYIISEIRKIPREDVEDSRAEGGEYPTVLIVGPKQYLHEIEKQLKDVYQDVTYSPSTDIEYSVIDGYEELLKESGSNIGYRILVEFFCKSKRLVEILKATQSGADIATLLDSDFVEQQLDVVEMIGKLRNGVPLSADEDMRLRSVLGNYYHDVYEHFRPKSTESMSVVDKAQPSILLTSYVGCKGLSAGHVFIVGANNGSIPKDSDKINDVEISQFVVALTRTRKQCHILTNKWLVSPKSPKGEWVREFGRSDILLWLPPDLIDDRGEFAASDFK